MTMLLISIASFVPMILLLVVIHEFGHYLTARMFRVKVHEFGVGFPPRLFAIHQGRTRVDFAPGTRMMDGEFSDLVQGQRVTLLSGDRSPDQPGQLAARYIWTGKPPKLDAIDLRAPLRRLAGRKTDAFEIHDGPLLENLKKDEGLLEHGGVIRSADENGIVIADMTWSINALPLGGYVRLAGEDNDERTPGGLARCPIWQRAIVIAAGAVVNALFPILAFTIMMMIPSQQSLMGGPVLISDVVPESPAQQAGLTAGDLVTHLDGQRVGGLQGLTDAIQRAGEGSVLVRFTRGTETRSVVVDPEPLPGYNDGRSRIGVQAAPVDTDREAVPPWQAVPRSVELTADMFSRMGQAIGGIATGKAELDVRGPIGIAQMSGLVTSNFGLQGWIMLSIIISINLAIFNLLPIPMLDGGRLFLLAIEACRGGRKIAPERERMVHIAGLAILVCIIAAVMAMDTAKIISG